MLVTIEVTAEEIASPHRTSATECMFALAARRAMPGRHVLVGVETMHVDLREVRLPPEVVARIHGYVARRPVGPFSATIRVPGRPAACSAAARPAAAIVAAIGLLPLAIAWIIAGLSR